MTKRDDDKTPGQDSRGQHYVEVGSIRITYVPAANRPSAKNWAKQDVLRVQASRANGKLHRGAEIPIGEPTGTLTLISGLCKLCKFVLDQPKS